MKTTTDQLSQASRPTAERQDHSQGHCKKMLDPLVIPESVENPLTSQVGCGPSRRIKSENTQSAERRQALRCYLSQARASRFFRRWVRGREALVVSMIFFAAPASAQTTDTIALAPLIKEAMHNHPRLKSDRLEASANWEVPSQVASLPDPFISISAQNIRFDDPGLDSSAMSALQFGLSQALPAWGKLRSRREQAVAAAKAGDKAVILSEAQVTLAVELAYWRVSYAQEALRITQESEAIINQLTNAVHSRFSVASNAAQQDALQAQVAHSRIRSMIVQRRQALDSARRALNAAAGRKPSDELGLVESPPSVSPNRMNRSAIVGEAIETNPAVALSSAYLEAADAAVATAKAERWPDFMAGVYYKYRAASPGDPTAGADMFGVTVGMTLPVWMNSKQNARVRQANAMKESATQRRTDVELAQETQLQVAIDQVESLEGELSLYEKEVLPESSAALDASIEDYTFDRVGFVSLLQNWQTDLDAQLFATRLRVDRVEKLAEIKALVGNTKVRK